LLPGELHGEHRLSRGHSHSRIVAQG
jgi:hypothetical protein